MEVIAHHGVGQAFDRKDGSKKLDPIADPLASMLVAGSRLRVVSAQKRATHTTVNAVEDLDLPRIHDFASSLPSHEFAPLKE